MPQPSPDVTERRMKRRRRGLSVAAIVMMTTLLGAQVSLDRIAAHQGRAVDMVRAGAFVALALVLMIVVLTGGRWSASDPATNDELVRLNRARALRVGYIVLMLAVIATYAAMLVVPVDFAAIVPALVLLGAVAPAVSFSYLERRGED